MKIDTRGKPNTRIRDSSVPNTTHPFDRVAIHIRSHRYDSFTNSQLARHKPSMKSRLKEKKSHRALGPSTTVGGWNKGNGIPLRLALRKCLMTPGYVFWVLFIPAPSVHRILGERYLWLKKNGTLEKMLVKGNDDDTFFFFLLLLHMTTARRGPPLRCT